MGAALAWAGAVSERLSESVGVSCSPRMFTMFGGWAMGLLPAMLRFARPLESGLGWDMLE